MATANRRFHAFDSLRGVMMLLGVYIHIACGYTNIPDTWWYTEKNTHWFFDFSLLFLHVFRMPVFFVMAGFFAALLHERYGWRGLAVNRFKRLVLPLLFGTATLYPLMNALQRYTRLWSKPDPMGETVRFMLSGRYWRWLHPMHLWFLIVLLFTLIVFYGLAQLCFRMPPTAANSLNQAFRRLLASRWAPFAFAIPSLATLLTMDAGLLDTTHSFLPEPRIVLAYFVFFVFGWLVYRNTDLLEAFEQNIIINIVLAIGIGIMNYVFAMWQLAALPARHWPGFIGTAITGALAVWLMLFGCAGLFLRWLDREIPLMRYLSDSSYWIYLAHAPVVLWLQILVAGLPISPFGKVALVFGGSIPVLFASYHLLVRATWIGVMLNGRRYTHRSPGQGVLAKPGGRLQWASTNQTGNPLPE